MFECLDNILLINVNNYLKPLKREICKIKKIIKE